MLGDMICGINVFVIWVKGIQTDAVLYVPVFGNMWNYVIDWVLLIACFYVMEFSMLTILHSICRIWYVRRPVLWDRHDPETAYSVLKTAAAYIYPVDHFHSYMVEYGSVSYRLRQGFFWHFRLPLLLSLGRGKEKLQLQPWIAFEAAPRSQNTSCNLI